MFWKEFLKNYLVFGKRDRIGLISVFAIIALNFVLPRFFARQNDPFPLKERAVLVKAIDTLEANQRNRKGNDEETASHQYESSEVKSFSPGKLFRFDPNTISIEGWKELGLAERTAKTINNYRNKGGKFYKPEDLQKIWGLPEGFYERVKNYIFITSLKKPSEPNNFSRPYERVERKIAAVNINSADTSAFIALPGIGSKLAFRIVNFRDKLGGFYSTNQVGETYGLPDSTFQKIKIYLQLSGDVKKLNINTATKEELKTHPYIKWNLANAIVEYRNQHGSFKSLEELRNIVLIDEATFDKIKHYLSL
jgi:competence protein ComEA